MIVGALRESLAGETRVGATAGGLAPLASIAAALREDEQAVAQGITTPYNSGGNEGRITDVKLQKRIMRTRWSRASPSPCRADRPPAPPLRGSGDRVTQMIFGYQNLARAGFLPAQVHANVANLVVAAGPGPADSQRTS